MGSAEAKSFNPEWTMITENTDETNKRRQQARLKLGPML
jgi:hypothetical protein